MGVNAPVATVAVGEPWAVGTDAAGRVRKELIEFIKTWLANPKYRARLPRQHWQMLDEGTKESAGVKIRVVAMADTRPPWSYRSGERQAVTDYHRVGVFVKADQKAGGAGSVSAFHGALRAMFAARDGEPERTALENAGVQECFESPEDFVGDPDASGETISAKQSIQLVCNSDTYLT